MIKIPGDSFIGTHYIGKEEENAAVEVIKSKSLFRYDGPSLLKKTLKLEEMLQEYLGVENLLVCSSGAAALKLCCIALGIGPGDEVLMSPFTFIASASAVLSCGAVPNFAEIDDSMNINPESIEERITSRTKAIMAIHIQGIPCEMDAIAYIAKKHNLYIIEDAAQAFGSSYKNKAIGTYGDAAAFSLQANKVITCGEGGIFTCKSKEGFNSAKRYHDNGGHREGDEYPSWNLPHCSFGENFKLTEIQSAIAIEQLKKADKIIAHQRELFMKLVGGLKIDKNRIRAIPENANPVPVSLCLQFDTEKECLDYLNAANSEGVPFEIYCDKILTTYTTFNNKQSWHRSGIPYNFSEYDMNQCPRSEDLCNRTAWLPISPLLGEEEISYIQNIMNKLSI